MKKLLFLSILFFVLIPNVYAGYKTNPFTGKQDYYSGVEQSGGLVLSDSLSIHDNLTVSSLVSPTGTVYFATVDSKGQFYKSSLIYPISDGGGAEADTLATVTGRGATTSTNIELSGDLSVKDDLTIAQVFYVISGTDNVGIGTSAPTQKLEVVGTLSVTGVTATSVVTPLIDVDEIDGVDSIDAATVSTFQTALNHDSLTGFVAAEHVNYTDGSAIEDLRASGELSISNNATIEGTLTVKGGFQGSGGSTGIYLDGNVGMDDSLTIDNDLTVKGIVYKSMSIPVAAENPDINKVYWDNVLSEVHPNGYVVSDVRVSADGTLAGNLSVYTCYRDIPTNAVAEPARTVIENIYLSSTELSKDDDGTLTNSLVPAGKQIGFYVDTAFDHRIHVDFIHRED